MTFPRSSYTQYSSVFNPVPCRSTGPRSQLSYFGSSVCSHIFIEEGPGRGWLSDHAESCLSKGLEWRTTWLLGCRKMEVGIFSWKLPSWVIAWGKQEGLVGVILSMDFFPSIFFAIHLVRLSRASVSLQSLDCSPLFWCVESNNQEISKKHVQHWSRPEPLVVKKRCQMDPRCSSLPCISIWFAPQLIISAAFLWRECWGMWEKWWHVSRF